LWPMQKSTLLQFYRLLYLFWADIARKLGLGFGILCLRSQPSYQLNGRLHIAAECDINSSVIHGEFIHRRFAEGG